jgi:protein-tyrosine phosphatase
MAEAVFRQQVHEKGMDDRFVIDSAGLIDVHEGEPADRRMRWAGEMRGYSTKHRSRPIRKADFDTFDLIVCMDRQNWSGLMAMAPSKEHKQKVHYMTDFSKDFSGQEVPDPYYGGDEGFDRVIDMLEESCTGLLLSI